MTVVAPAHDSKNFDWIFFVIGPTMPSPIGAVVDLADGRHLGGGAGEEHLVREPELVARDAPLVDRDAQLARELDAPCRA